MINEGMSDRAVLKEIGERLQRHRLDQNITQEDLATKAGLSRPTISDIERGQPASLMTLIRILRVLGLLPELNSFLPGPMPSPLELARSQGKQRRRASRPTDTDPEKDDPSW